MVICVPAWSSENTVAVVKKAAKKATFNVRATVSQPAAAVLAYGLADDNKQNALVQSHSKNNILITHFTLNYVMFDFVIDVLNFYLIQFITNLPFHSTNYYICSNLPLFQTCSLY